MRPLAWRGRPDYLLQGVKPRRSPWRCRRVRSLANTQAKSPSVLSPSSAASAESVAGYALRVSAKRTADIEAAVPRTIVIRRARRRNATTGTRRPFAWPPQTTPGPVYVYCTLIP